MDRRALIVLALALLAAAPPAAGAEAPASGAPAADLGDAPRVVDVELRVPAADRAAAAALVEAAPGAPMAAPALRATARNLYLTGRYASVVIRAEPAPAPPGETGRWVRLVVEARPARRLERLQVRVDGELPPDAVRAAARLAPGDPADEVDLDAAVGRVRALLARRGFRDAQVAATARGEARAVVELAVRTGPPVRVARVTVVGGAPPVEAALRTRAGAVLDEDALADDVRTLREALHAAGHLRARVDAPRVAVEGGRAEVELPVRAGPRMAFEFRGNAVVPDAVLRAQLGFEPGQPVDAPELDAALDRLRAFYRARGFADARLEVEEARRGADLLVLYRVAEGVRYRLAPVRVEGVSAREPEWVADRLVAYLDVEDDGPAEPRAERARALLAALPGDRAPAAPPPALPEAARWDEAGWDRAAEQVVDGYRAEGWLEAVYLGSSVALDRARGVAEVTLRFREGPRTRVESIAFEGNVAVPLTELAREARLAPGDPLRYEDVEATRTALLRLYLARGHVYARVEAREEVDRARDLAAVRYVVDEGPRVRLGRIVLTGNRRTRDEVVRGALHVAEGQVYDPDALARSQAALLRLGVFRSVNLRLQDPETSAAVKDLAVELSERPYATLTQGVGYSIANGPRAVLEYTRPNLLGRALEATARGKVNYLVELGEFGPDVSGKTFGDRIEGRADVGLRSSGLELLGWPAGGRVDVIGEVLHRRAYDLNRAGGVAGVDLGVTSRVGVSLQYELEVDEIARTAFVGNLTQADLERLRFDEGVTTLQVFRPSFSLDFRDNAAHPHRGWFAAGALEYARSLGTSDRRALGFLPGSDIHTNLLKLSGTLSGYLPIGRASVVALALRGGRVFPQDGTSRTIIPRRFFLGGASSMRGYGEEEMIQEDVRGALAEEARLCATSPTGVGCTGRGRRVAAGLLPVSEGGEAYLLAKTELRLALSSSVEAGFFVDLGNLWLDPRQFELLSLRANAGFGLRFVTPVGPAALDFGFNVDRDASINERLFAPHFTIGLF